MDWVTALWQPILSAAAVTIGGMLARRYVRSDSDAKRAALLSRIADDAVSVIRVRYPNLAYLDLVRMVTDEIRRNSPTGNTDVLSRVAAAAVARVFLPQAPPGPVSVPVPAAPSPPSPAATPKSHLLPPGGR